MSIYSDVINVDDLWEKRETFSDERGEMSYWCKDCEGIVEAKLFSLNELREKFNSDKININTEITPSNLTLEKINKLDKKEYHVCEVCNNINISIWTEEWLK